MKDFIKKAWETCAPYICDRDDKDRLKLSQSRVMGLACQIGFFYFLVKTGNVPTPILMGVGLAETSKFLHKAAVKPKEVKFGSTPEEKQ
jgi:hypothetical protein